MSTKSEQGSGAKSVNEAQLIMTESKEKDPSCARLRGEGAWTVRKRITENLTLWDVHCGGNIPALEAPIGGDAESVEGATDKGLEAALLALKKADEFIVEAKAIFRGELGRDWADDYGPAFELLSDYETLAQKSLLTPSSVSPNVAGASEEEKETSGNAVTPTD